MKKLNICHQSTELRGISRANVSQEFFCKFLLNWVSLLVHHTTVLNFIHSKYVAGDRHLTWGSKFQNWCQLKVYFKAFQPGAHGLHMACEATMCHLGNQIFSYICRINEIMKPECTMLQSFASIKALLLLIWWGNIQKFFRKSMNFPYFCSIWPALWPYC